jgi:hypothetical protein
VLRGRAVALLDDWRDGIAAALAKRGTPKADARLLAAAVVALLDDAADRWAARGGRGDLNSIARDAIAVLERTRSRP